MNLAQLSSSPPEGGMACSFQSKGRYLLNFEIAKSGYEFFIYLEGDDFPFPVALFFFVWKFSHCFCDY